MPSSVLLIAGPTASGKSWLADEIAKERSGTVINGDSMQVYQGLEIITAQPPCPSSYKLYGFLDPTQPCTAALWCEKAVEEIEACFAQSKLPIIVGGTGLYLKALTQGLSPIPTIPQKVQKQARQHYEEIGGQQFYEELSQRDSSIVGLLNPHDSQRLIRAYEVLVSTGKSITFWQDQPLQPTPYSFYKVLILPPKPLLENRMVERLDRMMKEGALEEVKMLMNLDPELSAMKAIGVPELRSYLKDEMTLEEAKERILIASRQYAKRQSTWFRNQYNADLALDHVPEKGDVEYVCSNLSISL